MDLPPTLLGNPEDSGEESIRTASFWDTAAVHQLLVAAGGDQSLRSTERRLEQANLLPAALDAGSLQDDSGNPPNKLVLENFTQQAKRKRTTVLYAQLVQYEARWILFGNDGRGGRRWIFLEGTAPGAEAKSPGAEELKSLRQGLNRLAAAKNLLIWPQGLLVDWFQALTQQVETHSFAGTGDNQITLGSFAYQPTAVMTLDGRTSADPDSQQTRPQSASGASGGSKKLSHLEELEAQSIHIMREVAAQAENPVMLYSVGKDSSAMLHLAKKAFYPSPPPFPLLHVDTRWKFQAMYRFRDQIAKRLGMELLVYINPEGVEKDINPFDHGSALHTDIMKTQGLKAALDKYGFDVAFGGARRDEEKSRAKERVFSFRSEAHRWDPKNQRPELWNLYNTSKNPGESIRVFPLSNWTELDIWQYLYQEQVPLVPLYFSAERPVVERDGMLMMVDDERMRLYEGEDIELKRLRFRTLGCYPLTGAVESGADDLPSIILELLQSRSSERQGRAIDSDSSASMEKKKQEGYF